MTSALEVAVVLRELDGVVEDEEDEEELAVREFEEEGLPVPV